jgi:hypothetical protein
VTRAQFNPPPGWPTPPEGWTPPAGWTPDPSWPQPPPGWVFWTFSSAEQTDGTPRPDAPPPPDSETANQQPQDFAERSSDSLAATPRTAEATTITDEQPSERRAEIPSREVHEARESDSSATTNELRASELQERIRQLSDEEQQLHAQLVELNDAVVLQQVGIYEYHHPLENAERYRSQLAELQQQIKDAVRAGWRCQPDLAPA